MLATHSKKPIRTPSHLSEVSRFPSVAFQTVPLLVCRWLFPAISQKIIVLFLYLHFSDVIITKEENKKKLCCCSKSLWYTDPKTAGSTYATVNMKTRSLSPFQHQLPTQHACLPKHDISKHALKSLPALPSHLEVEMLDAAQVGPTDLLAGPMFLCVGLKGFQQSTNPLLIF